MKWWQVLLGFIVNLLWILPILGLLSEALIEYKQKIEQRKFIKKANEEYRKSHPPRQRRYCIQCSYCRWKYYHPFSRYGGNYWSFVSKIPYYCKKFKTPLREDSLLTCISELDSEAMYEDTN